MLAVSGHWQNEKLNHHHCIYSTASQSDKSSTFSVSQPLSPPLSSNGYCDHTHSSDHTHLVTTSCYSHVTHLLIMSHTHLPMGQHSSYPSEDSTDLLPHHDTGRGFYPGQPSQGTAHSHTETQDTCVSGFGENHLARPLI